MGMNKYKNVRGIGYYVFFFDFSIDGVVTGYTVSAVPTGYAVRAVPTGRTSLLGIGGGLWYRIVSLTTHSVGWMDGGRVRGRMGEISCVIAMWSEKG